MAVPLWPCFSRRLNGCHNWVLESKGDPLCPECRAKMKTDVDNRLKYKYK